MSKLTTGKLIAAILSAVLSSAAVAGSDDRAVVTLDKGERGLLLAEMRAMLEALQDIAKGLADEDMNAVSNAARPLGAPLKEKLSAETMAKLPQDFQTLANSLSTDFLQMSADAKTMQEEKHTLGQLSNLMAKCLACHKAYQVKEK